MPTYFTILDSNWSSLRSGIHKNTRVSTDVVKQLLKDFFVYFPFSPLPTQLRVYLCMILRIPCPQKMRAMRSLMMD